MKHIKKILLGVVALGLLVTGVYYFMNQQSSTIVKVYPTMMFAMTEDWTQQSYLQGNVITDQLQPVYISNTQTLTEVLVTEGQEVKKGDILLTYDSTLSELSLVRKDLEIQKTQLALDRATQELATINSYRPGVPIVIASSNYSSYRLGVEPEETISEDVTFNIIYENLNTEGLEAPKVLLKRILDKSEDPPIDVFQDPIVEPSETGFTFVYKDLLIKEAGKNYSYSLFLLGENDKIINNEEHYTSIHDEDVVVTYKGNDIINSLYDKESEPKYPNLLIGSGTQEDPYIFKYNDKMSINTAFMEELMSDTNLVFAKFYVFLDDDEALEVLQTFSMRFDKLVDEENGTVENLFTFLDLSLGDPDEQEPGGEDPGIPIDPGPPTITYTANELFRMRTEKEAEIRDLNLSIKTATVEYSDLENEINNNFILAQLDGVVSEVIDEETAKLEGRQLFQVSSSGSFIVETTITELDLQQIKIGDPMSIFSYESGAYVEGQVMSISPYPTTNSMYFGYGPQNQSSYPVKISVDKSADLKTGMWVEIQRIDTSESPEQFFALMNAFVRTDDGDPYVWIAQDEKLVKKPVTIGRTIQGSYIQILNDDVTMDDMVAFPYGKSLREGQPVEEGTYEDLYNPLGG